MPQVGIRVNGTEYTWDEARVASEDASFPYPPPLIEAMADRRDDKQPSASTLSDCLRRFELKRSVPYYGDPDKELAPLFGTGFHALMDKYRQQIMQPGDLSETRLYANIRVFPYQDDETGQLITFGGQFDFFRPGVLLSDWKSKKYIPAGFTVQEGHVRQANIYNWLAVQNGYEAARDWEIAYVDQSRALRFQGRMQPVARVESFIRRRLTEWAQSASSGTLPPPVSAFYESDAKGKPLAPCLYCEVREQCRAALKADAPRPFGNVDYAGLHSGDIDPLTGGVLL